MGNAANFGQDGAIGIASCAANFGQEVRLSLNRALPDQERRLGRCSRHSKTAKRARQESAEVGLGGV